MTHDDMDQAMEVLGQPVTRPGEVKPQRPKMLVSLRQKTSEKQTLSLPMPIKEEEKATDPIKTLGDPVATSDGD